MQDDLKLYLMNGRLLPIFSKAFIVVLGLLMSNLSFAQAQTMTCNDNIQLSLAPQDLDGDGTTDVCGAVTRDHFIDGVIPANDHVLEINGALHAEQSVGGTTYFDVNWVQYIGQTVDYKIIDAETSNSCWGTATVEANVFDAPELPCQYTPAIHEIVEVKTGSGCITKTYAELGIVIDPTCQVPVVSVEGDAKYACDAGNDGIMGTLDDGWCTVKCEVTGTATGFEVCIIPPAGSTLPGDVVCEIHVKADECIDCETWCPGPIEEEMSIEDMKSFLASSCFAEVSEIFRNVEEFGDACTGLTKIVTWSGMVNQHGTDVLIDLGEQAFKVSPLHLFRDGANGTRVCNIYNPDPLTGSGILILPPPTVSLNCGDNADDLTKTGQPRIVNHHKDVTTTTFDCLDIHYIEVVDIIKDSPTLFTDPVTGEEIWILADKFVKEQQSMEFCNPTDYVNFFTGKLVTTKSAIGDIVEIINRPTRWPTTSVTGPEILTFDELGEFACNTLLSAYTNDTIPACGTGIKVLRTWTLVDWCTSETKSYDQLIEVIDKKAPTIDKDPAEITLSIEPWVCTAAISDADPGFVDDCNNDYTVNVEVTDVASGVWVDPAGGLPVGDYVVAFTAVDACGNASKPYEVTYHIVDQVKPNAVCEDNIIVSLTSDDDGAIGKAFADDFDKASHDGGCAEIKFKEVIRMDHLEGGLDCQPFTKDITTTELDKFGEVVSETTETEAVFGPFVKFCCADEGDQLVVLRVWDGVSADGLSGAGNFNECMVRVTVQNKLSANIACSDETIVCTEYTGDPKDFGGFTVGDTECANGDIEELDPVVDVNSCGVGTIVRTFVLANGQLCRSTITVTGDGSFDPSTIKWPLHHTDDVITVITKEEDTRTGSDTFGECVVTGTDTYTTRNLSCGEDAAPCEPSWTSDACGLVGVSHTDEIVEFDQDACYKIIRRWTVVDWCTWGPNDGNETLDDENDTNRDTYEACSDWCTTEACNVYYRYSDVEEDGYYTFDQVIKVVDQIAPEVTCTAETVGIGIGDGCVGDITFSASGVDGSECPSEEISYSWTVTNAGGTSVGSGVGSEGSVEGLAQGTYTVRFVATDGCGNSGSTTCDVTLKEEKAPTPYCYAISTAVMNNGMVEIWASDFIQKGEDNCTAEEDLLASFSGDEFEPNLLLTCDNVTGREKNIRIYLWDEAGNADFCVQTIRVDSNGHCDGDTEDGDGDTGDGDTGDGDGDTGDGDTGDGDANTGGNSTCPGTEGGVLLTDPTDLDAITICAGDGVSDAFDAKIWENLGDASWLITDSDGNILDIPAGPPFNFDGAGEGVCLVWHVSSTGDLTGVEVGANAADIGGCFSLSNPITVTRVSSGEACEAAASSALVGGNLSTEDGDIVAEAEVMLNNNVMPEYPVMKMSSNSTGNYAFGSNPMNNDYALSASKDVDPTNGVSTLDLVLIQKHILGLRSLDSPYKVIAADVNGDQKVSASDLVQLRQLILGTASNFTNNQSWRFVDASQTFDNALSPWPFTEVIDVNALSHNMIENFIGVKTGDVNNDAKANSFMQTEVRSNGNLILATANAEVAKNDNVSIAVTSDNFSEVYGFQFTMEHAGLTLVDVVNGALDITEANVGVREGVLTMSWNDSDGVSTSDVLFTLNFRSSVDLALNKAISINSRITSAEAYLGGGLAHNDVELVFTDGKSTIEASSYVLHQNEPNPFSANTNISFELPSSGQATISVFDVTGKVVRTHVGQFAKGLNTVNFTRNELGAVSGVLYYQLSSGEFTATKKMIIIE